MIFVHSTFGIRLIKLGQYFEPRVKMCAGTIPQYLIEKDKYLTTPKEERRKQNPNYVPLDTIVTWESYFKSNKERLQTLDTTYLKELFNIQEYSLNNELNKKVSIWQGDITKLEVECIVNAANKSLLGGGGVDGAIHRGAGKYLLEECKLLSGCDTGEAKITGGYKLPTKYIIHTVGPIGENPSALENCYRNSVKVALESQLRSIAFPCISTGVYGYPQDSAANVAIRTIRLLLLENLNRIDQIIFCLFLSSDVDIYEKLMQLYFPCE